MLSMSAQDATFLHVENDVTPMHIGGVSIFEYPWRPGPEPSDVELFVRGAYHRERHPAEQASAAVRARSERLRGTVRMMRAIASAAPAVRRWASSLTGPIGPHRVWSWASARLSDVKDVRSSLGGTVNDVVLAIVTSGFRGLLLERGEQIRGGGAADRPRVRRKRGQPHRAVHESGPLHEAAAKGNLEMIELLLAHGADPNLRDNSYDATPAGWAEHFNQMEALRYLAALET